MSMVVQHNITAMNANRMLGMTASSQAKSTEKLSSGYKINRAADDAAGLSISEKMRKQIRGLTQASSNAQDGISAVQTAEGALSETQSMLQRMNELANQAANDTNSESDRQSIQDEIDQLATEIDRVSETTKFNEIYLLNGDASGQKTTTYGYSTQASVSNTDLLVANTDGTFSTVKAGSILEEGTTYYSGTTDEYVGEKIDFTSGAIVGTKIGATDLTGTSYAETVDVLNKDYYILTGDVYVKVASGTKHKAGETYYEMTDVAGGSITYAAVSSGAVSTATATVFKTDVDVWDKDGNKVEGGAVIVTGDTYFSDIDKSKDNQRYVSARVLVEDDDLYTKATDGSYVKVEKGTEFNTLGTYYKMTEESGSVTYSVKETDSITTTAGFIAAVTIYDADGKTIAAGSAVDTGATYYSTVNKATKGIAVTDMDSVKASASGFQFMDKYGNEIAANGLYQHFDDAGAYKGGLYTKDANGTLVEADADLVSAYTETGESKTGVLKFSLQVGADATSNNQIDVEIEAMNAGTLGVKGLSVSGADNKNAKNAIETIDAALKKVSGQRSTLGAVQNRLEHTISNLDNIVENTTSAESQIRDTDMASEMVNYSKNSILAQAGQSMLAQANQSNQGVLSLLG